MRKTRPMDFPIRVGTLADMPEILRIDDVAFGHSSTEQELTDLLMVLDPTRFLIATDADSIVGMTADYLFSMAVPGGDLDLPGVTWVSVAITHRRRGILTALMAEQLRRYQADGYAAAVLTASEGGIYERFGYGPATEIRRTVVNRRRARLRTAVDSTDVRVASPEEAQKLLPELYERWRRVTPGAVSRSEGWWQRSFLDREYQRDAMSGLFHLVHPEGYVSFRARSDWNDGHPQHGLWISDYVMTSPAAHAALWQVLLGMDLYGDIEGYRIPLDDPLPYLLSDGREFRSASLDDGVWVRPIHVDRLLAARSYAIDVEAVLEVSDPMFGDGRYRLVAGPGGATCTRTDAHADVHLDVAALGSVYLGGHRMRRLAGAGRIAVADDALLTRLDRAFLADKAPSHGTGF